LEVLVDRLLIFSGMLAGRKRPLMRGIGVSGFMVLLACGDVQVADNGSRADDCVRPPPRDFTVGEVVRIDADGPGPCAIVFEETGVQLVADSAGRRPDPGRRIIRDARGRYLSAMARGFDAFVAVWDSSGAFVQALGGPGGGPGELSETGTISLFTDAKGRIHVRDGRPDWSIFDEDMHFLSKAPAASIGGLYGRTIVFDDGTVLAAHPVAGSRRHYFHIADLTGRTIRRFAPYEDPRVHRRRDRQVVRAGADRFWAAPVEIDGSGYVLELWNTRGELLRTVRRDVEWFPATGPVDDPSSPPPPNLEILTVDSSGIVITTSAIPNQNWVPRDRQSREVAQYYDLMIEAIDTRTMTLLVSERLAGSKVDRLIPQCFSGIRQCYRLKEDDRALPIVSIVAYRLVRRNAGERGILSIPNTQQGGNDGEPMQNGRAGLGHSASDRCRSDCSTSCRGSPGMLLLASRLPVGEKQLARRLAPFRQRGLGRDGGRRGVRPAGVVRGQQWGMALHG
jgi:hypothetical protein